MNRRRVLLFGLGGAAALACGGALSWFTAGYSVPPEDRPLGLTVKELAVVRAIVEALLPADGDLPSGLAVGVHQRIDEEVWSQPDPMRDDLKSAISLLEHLPPFYGLPHRLTRLAPAEREAFLAHVLLNGPRPAVQAAGALKQLCGLFYWGHADTWAAIGYDGPLVPAQEPPSSARYRELTR